MPVDEINAAPAPSSPPLALGSAPTPKFSLERLSSAFARLMGAPPTTGRSVSELPQVAVAAEEDDDDETSLVVTPQMIVEGMLFVGAPAGKTLTSQMMASQIRDVTSAEVESIIAELNETYRRDAAAYEIVAHGGGFRLQLRSDLAPFRDRFRGRVRAAKLTPPAVEVLSIVAYRQGITAEEINRLRGAQSHALLAQLVRRQLLRVDRAAGPPRQSHYRTTERFNQLFKIASPAELPQDGELADS